MKEGPQWTVTEETAKCMRIWEELGGPDYLTLDNAKEVAQQMTPTEFGEVPTWPKKDDARLKVFYTLPRRLARKPRFKGF